METLEDQELAAAVRVAIAQALADMLVAQAEAAASRMRWSMAKESESLIATSS